MTVSQKLLSGFKILVVEDEVVIREMIQEELESNGAAVVTASGGNEAFDIFCKQRFDAVMSDVRMPGGDGVGLMKRIRDLTSDPAYDRANRTAKLFLCSAYGEQAATAAQDLRLTGILAKPFTWDALLATLAQSLIGEKSSA